MKSYNIESFNYIGNYISELIEEKYAEIAELKNTLMEDRSTV